MTDSRNISVRHYTGDTVRVTLDPSGGRFDVGSFDVDRDSSLKAVLYALGDPVKSGYKFMGWRYADYMPPIAQIVDIPAYEDCTLTAIWLPEGTSLIGDDPISEEFKLNTVGQYESWRKPDKGGKSDLDIQTAIKYNVYKYCRKNSDGSLNVFLYDMSLFNFGTVTVQPSSGGNGYRYSFQYCSELARGSVPPTAADSAFSIDGKFYQGPFAPSADGSVSVYFSDAFSKESGGTYYCYPFDLSRWFKIYYGHNDKISGIANESHGCEEIPVEWTGMAPVPVNRQLAACQYAQGQQGWYTSLDVPVQVTITGGVLRKFKVVS